MYYLRPCLLVCSVQSHIDILPRGSWGVLLRPSFGPRPGQGINHPIHIGTAELGHQLTLEAHLFLIIVGPRTHGIEYLSLVYSLSSPSLLGGALTRCNVDLSSSFDQRIMKSPILNTMAPGTGGAGRKRSFWCWCLPQLGRSMMHIRSDCTYRILHLKSTNIILEEECTGREVLSGQAVCLRVDNNRKRRSRCEP